MFQFREDHLTGFKLIESTDKDGYTINDVIYESPYKGEVSACLFIPDHALAQPAVIFMHSLQGNRNTFFKEAEHLAKKGFVSLLLESPFLRGKHQPGYKRFIKTIEPMVDIQTYFQTITEIRRGISLLAKQAFVDQKKIAYVGHCFGATWGGVMAGIETRIQTFILMGGASKVSDWYMKSEHPKASLIRSLLPTERFDHFISNLKKVDAINYIKNAAPASVFFQYAKDDAFLDYNQAAAFYAAASSPKKMTWYETDHEFSFCEDALSDRSQWLIEQIGSPSEKFLTESTKN